MTDTAVYKDPDGVNVYFAKDQFGRWVWTVEVYTIGTLQALTLTEDFGEAVEHFRNNACRIREAMKRLAEDVE